MSNNGRLEIESVRHGLSDWILVGAIAGGLFSPLILILLVPAILIRGGWLYARFRIENMLLLLAAAWGCFVIAIRGADNSAGLLPYFAFLWIFPQFVALYRPDQKTIRGFESLLITLFVFDLIFNIGTLINGDDLLGRVLDAREGLFSARLGGIFAHSFYSGAISVAALLTIIARERCFWLGLLPAINLLLSGSWRFTLVLLIVAVLFIRWRQRSRFSEMVIVVTFSVAIIAGVLMSSGLFSGDWSPNGSNTLRVYAWLSSIEKIADSPWIGVGYPNERAIEVEGASIESMENNLVAESWYLSSAITFGVPYTLLFLATFIAAFLGQCFPQRNLTQAILYPFVLIDLVYGSFFGGILIYSWIWLLVFATPLSKQLLKPSLINNEATNTPKQLSL